MIDTTEIVRGMDPSWYESMLMKMATKYPEEFYSAFSDVISENAARRVTEDAGIVGFGMTDPPD